MANEDLLAQGVLRMAVDMGDLPQMGSLLKGVSKQVTQAQRLFGDTEKKVTKADKAAARLNKTFEAVQSGLKRANESVSNFANKSSGFFDSLSDSQGAYLQRLGATDKASINWMKSTARVEQAQARLGRVTTQALQPTQELYAKLIDQAATLAEKGQSFASAGINTFAGLQQAQQGNYAGAAVSAVSGGFSLGQGIAGGLGQAGVIDKSTAEAIKLQKASKLAGDTMGLLTYAIVEWSTNGLELMIDGVEALGRTFGDVSAVITAGFDQTKKAQLLAENKAYWDKFHKDTVGALNQMSADAAVSVSNFVSEFGAGLEGQSDLPVPYMFSEDDLRQFAQFNLQREQEQKQFDQQQSQADEQFNRQQLQQQADFERQSLQQADDYNRQKAQAEADFARELGQSDSDHRREVQMATADFNRQTKKAEEDFQLQRLRAQEDHYRNMQDAAARLDALGVLNEQRSFTTDDQRAKQDHALEVKRSKDEFKLQQKIQDEAYRIQRQRTIDNFRYQQKLADQNFQREQQRAKAEFDYQQQVQAREYQFQRSQQAAQYNLQRQMQADQYRWQLQQQQMLYTQTATQLQSYWSTLRSQINAFVNSGTIPGGGSDYGGSAYHGMAEGGYTRDQTSLIRSHPKEFMLNNSTTKMLEGMAGGKLTQSNIVSLAAGGKGISVGDMNFYDVGSKAPGELQKEVRGAFADILRDYNEGRL